MWYLYKHTRYLLCRFLAATTQASFEPFPRMFYFVWTSLRLGHWCVSCQGRFIRLHVFTVCIYYDTIWYCFRRKNFVWRCYQDQLNTEGYSTKRRLVRGDFSLYFVAYSCTWFNLMWKDYIWSEHFADCKGAEISRRLWTHCCWLQSVSVTISWAFIPYNVKMLSD